MYGKNIQIEIQNLASIGDTTLILFIPINFSIKLHAIKSGWSIVYKESQVINQNTIESFSLMIDFVLANSADIM